MSASRARQPHALTARISTCRIHFVLIIHRRSRTSISTCEAPGCALVFAGFRPTRPPWCKWPASCWFSCSPAAPRRKWRGSARDIERERERHTHRIGQTVSQSFGRDTENGLSQRPLCDKGSYEMACHSDSETSCSIQRAHTQTAQHSDTPKVPSAALRRIDLPALQLCLSSLESSASLPASRAACLSGRNSPIDGGYAEGRAASDRGAFIKTSSQATGCCFLRVFKKVRGSIGLALKRHGHAGT